MFLWLLNMVDQYRYFSLVAPVVITPKFLEYMK